MTKTALAIAAALLAGTTLTGAANAGGLRVGFGFPLGSFVAHSNQSYDGGGYGRQCDHEHRAVRRHYEAAAAPVRRVKPKAEVAETKTIAKPITTAKLDDRLTADTETTTDIAKTTDTDADTTTATKADPAPATTASTDTAKTEKVATVDKTADEGSDLKVIKVPNEGKQVCRRYSAAIAALVDVPCDGK